LQFEALNARNARRTAIIGIDTAAVDPTGGVPQPAPFPIAKTEYLRALKANSQVMALGATGNPPPG
jgi:hypothetical protein